MRFVLSYVVPFLLPFAGYGVWLFFARQAATRRAAGTLPRWQDGPWTWLVVAGVGFVVIALFGLGLAGNRSTEGTYVPPHVEDGEVVPGHVE